jgi:hypothetical protein
LCGVEDGAFGQGSTIRFDYPAASSQGIAAPAQKRRLRVEAIRSLVLEPLSPLTLELDPDLPRGQVLVTGHDLDKQSVRSFYLERMEQIETLSLRDEFEQRGGEDRATGENAGKCFLPLARTWRRMTSWLRRTCDCRQPGA